MSVPTLPIWQLEESILHAAASSKRLVIIAPTGSGKTTQVPQMLLDSGLAGLAGRIVVLQPRRVAARTVAARVAWERQCKLGAEVGYQIRFDDRTSLGTRICFVTEGILLRWLQDDPALEGVQVLLFDEFHERNLLSDVGLALAKQLQQSRRPDLIVMVMSATLEAEPVSQYLSLKDDQACPVLLSEGRAYPVEIEFLDRPDPRHIYEQAADAAESIVQQGLEGDILIFMPGMGEIQATLGALRAAKFGERVSLIPLHGDLSAEEQDLAFQAQPHRKIVVATNVAETSVTIDGIRHVIDSGQARIARYDSDRGLGTLFIEPISRASAEQRAGRAGRTAPGTCHRLWTESAHLNRPERNTPEIQRSDLAEVVLLLHSLGIRDAAAFDWLDKPDEAAVRRAERLLIQLGALEADGGALSAIGRQMLKAPMHPRFSRMLVEAAKLGCVRPAALCAALVSGRDLLMRVGREDKRISEARELFEASPESDFYTLMRAYYFARKNGFSGDACRRYGIHGQTARQVEQTYEQIIQIAAARDFVPVDPNVPESAVGKAERKEEDLLRCITTGFVDQLCVRRDRGTLECEMVEGRSGTLMRESVVQNAPLLVVANVREVEGRTGKMTLLGLATAVQRPWLEASFPQHFSVALHHVYDRTHKRVAAVRQTRFLDLVIEQAHEPELDPEASGAALADAHLRGWFELPKFNHEIKQFIARVQLIGRAMRDLDLPRFNGASIRGCLARAFQGLSLAKEAQITELRPAFLSFLGADKLAWIDELAPSQIAWCDGRRLKLLYVEETDDQPEGDAPELQVKLHETFRLEEHPTVCEGRVPVRLWLAGPDGKRLAMTTNWKQFRQIEYPKLKPALQRKYPGVAWI